MGWRVAIVGLALGLGSCAPAAKEDTRVPAQAGGTVSGPALVFRGDGIWDDEVRALESLLSQQGVAFRDVDSAGLNRLEVDELAAYRALIWPGVDGEGNAERMYASIDPETRGRIRQAVVERGVGYLGFCAGAFMAVSPEPGPSEYPLFFSLLLGEPLDYYRLQGVQGGTPTMTLETLAGGRQKDLVWYGGPVTPEIPGGVVARYPTGEPAISQAWSGRGLVVVAGVHPAASAEFREQNALADADGLDLDLAWELLRAVLAREPMPVL